MACIKEIINCKKINIEKRIWDVEIKVPLTSTSNKSKISLTFAIVFLSFLSIFLALFTTDSNDFGNIVGFGIISICCLLLSTFSGLYLAHYSFIDYFENNKSILVGL